MNKGETKVARLLHAAARAEEAAPAEMPFGFETRVLAHWREARSLSRNELRDLVRVFRRIALIATIVIVSASSAAYWQFRQNDEWEESSANAYAIADNAIETGAFQ